MLCQNPCTDACRNAVNRKGNSQSQSLCGGNEIVLIFIGLLRLVMFGTIKKLYKPQHKQQEKTELTRQPFRDQAAHCAARKQGGCQGQAGNACQDRNRGKGNLYLTHTISKTGGK